jgi:hypothetical protein
MLVRGIEGHVGVAADGHRADDELAAERPRARDLEQRPLAVERLRELVVRAVALDVGTLLLVFRRR